MPDYKKYDAELTDGSTTLKLKHFETEAAPARTQLLPLDAPKQATNENEMRPEYGWFWGQTDFSGGANQEKFHGPGADPVAASYYFSEHLEIATRGQVTLSGAASSPSPSLTVPFNTGQVFNKTLFLGTFGTDTYSTTDLSTFTAETSNATRGFATDGSVLFQAAGTSIRQRDTSGTWSQFSTEDAKYLLWARERLIASDTDNNTLKEITKAGVSTTVDILSGRHAIPMTVGGQYIYVGWQNNSANYQATHTRLIHYGLNAAGTLLERKGETEMPDGEAAFAICGHGGIVYIGAGRINTARGYDPVLYAGVIQASGELQLEEIAYKDLGSTERYGVGGITRFGNKLLFPWPQRDPTTGTIEFYAGTYDTAREAFSLTSTAPTPSTEGTNHATVMAFLSRRVALQDGIQPKYETAVRSATGTLITSSADFNQPGTLKTWTSIELATKPLPSGATIQVYYSIKHPDENVWTLAGTHSGTGDEGDRFSLSGVTSRQLTLRFVLNRATDTSTGPTLLGYTVRANPKPATTEYVLERTFLLTRVAGQMNDPDAALTQLEDWAYTNGLTLTERRKAWTCRLENIEHLDPAVPINRHALNDAEHNVHLVKITFVATRN